MSYSSVLIFSISLFVIALKNIIAPQTLYSIIGTFQIIQGSILHTGRINSILVL